jgi:hypothetical protein
MLARYYISVFRTAAARTWVFASTQGLVVGIVLAFLGVATGIFFQLPEHPTWVTVAQNLSTLALTALVSGITPIFVLTGAAFCYQLLCAPADMAESSEAKCRDLEARLSEINKEISRGGSLVLSVKNYRISADKGGLNVKADVLVVNPGEQTALHSWQAIIALQSGQRIATVGFLEIPELSGKRNLSVDDQVIVHGGKREGFLSFNIYCGRPVGPASVEQIFFQCRDGFNNFYEFGTHPVEPSKLAAIS